MEHIRSQRIQISDNKSIDDACTDYAIAYYRREKYRQMLERLSTLELRIDDFIPSDETETEPNPVHMLRAHNLMWADILQLYIKADRDFQEKADR